MFLLYLRHVMSWCLVKYKSNYNIILSYLLLFSLLIVCGDIELNPGPQGQFLSLLMGTSKPGKLMSASLILLSKCVSVKNIISKSSTISIISRKVSVCLNDFIDMFLLYLRHVMSWCLVKYKSNYNIILSYLLLFSL
jgi:hypothetical protein